MFALNEIANKYLSYMEGEWNCWLLYKTYTKTDSLFMVHTGNTVGMRGITTATAYQYNALITRDTNLSFAGVPSSVDPLTFAGTTNDWTLNGSGQDLILQ